MNKINLTAPTDYTTEQVAIDRQRKLAELMQDQSMQPIQNDMSGGWAVPISPWQGLAKMAQAGAGAYGQQAADARTKALAARMRGDTAGALERFQAKSVGTPEQFSGELGTPDELYTPAKPPDLRGAYSELLNSQDPILRNAAMAKMLKGDEDFTLGEGQKRFRGSSVIAEGGPRTFAPPAPQRPLADNRPEVVRLQELLSSLPAEDPRRKDLEGRIARLNHIPQPAQTHISNPAAVTPVTIQDPNDPNGTIVIDGRTRAVLGKGPKLTESGRLENKRQFNMQGIGATLKEARELLTGTATGNKPTQSGIGAAVDYLGSLVGESPTGAIEAARLKSAGGALTAKMPRMEGPQSDKDTLLYKEMAGKIGDATVPIDQRLAALSTVENLWAKYERLNPDAFEGRRSSDILNAADAIINGVQRGNR